MGAQVTPRNDGACERQIYCLTRTEAGSPRFRFNRFNSPEGDREASPGLNLGLSVHGLGLAQGGDGLS